MPAPPSCDFYFGDFVKSTTALDARATGAYVLLLAYQWEHGQIPLYPEQRRRVARIEGADNWAVVWNQIGDRFDVVDETGNRQQKRMADDRKRANARWEQRKKAAKLGGKAKKRSEADRVADRVPDRVPETEGGRGKYSGDDGGAAQPNQATGAPKQPTTQGAQWGRCGYPQDFEAFWVAYPTGRKNKKAEAAKIWQRLARDGVDLDLVTARAAEYAASDEGNGEYVAGPVPWLRGGRWDDDPAAWRRKSPPTNAEITRETLTRNLGATHVVHPRNGSEITSDIGGLFLTVDADHRANG